MERVFGWVIPDALFIFAWCTIKVLPKDFIKVAGVVKSYGKSKLRNRTGMWIILLDHISSFEDPMFHEIFNGSDLQGSFETAAALAFADMNSRRQIVQRNTLSVVLFNLHNCFFDAGFI